MISHSVQQSIEAARATCGGIKRRRDELLAGKLAKDDFERISALQHTLFEVFSTYKGIYLSVSEGFHEVLQEEMIGVEELLGELELLKWFADNISCYSQILRQLDTLRLRCKERREQRARELNSFFKWDEHWNNALKEELQRVGADRLLIDVLVAEGGVDSEITYPSTPDNLVHIFSHSSYSREVLLYLLVDIGSSFVDAKGGGFDMYISSFCHWFHMSEHRLRFVKALWSLDEGGRESGPRVDYHALYSAPTAPDIYSPMKEWIFMRIGMESAEDGVRYARTQLHEISLDVLYVVKLELLIQVGDIRQAVQYLLEHKATPVVTSDSGEVDTEPDLSGLQILSRYLLERLAGGAKGNNAGLLSSISQILGSEWEQEETIVKAEVGSVRNAAYWDGIAEHVSRSLCYEGYQKETKSSTDLVGTPKEKQKVLFRVQRKATPGKSSGAYHGGFKPLQSPNPLTASPTVLRAHGGYHATTRRIDTEIEMDSEGSESTGEEEDEIVFSESLKPLSRGIG